MLTGFDCSAYPGDTTMQTLKKDFAFCGFYLAPAPSHGNTGWMNKLSTLRNMKYKFLPIFVGQQVIGPGSKQPSAANGIADAKKTAQLMLSAGFNHGSPVYLDLENGPPYTLLESQYTTAWVDEVAALGFIPGIYASHLLTPHLPTKALIWDFKIPTTARTFMTLPMNYPPELPAGLAARQYLQNVVLRGTGILVDINQAPDATGLAS
jgi:hypothetical protein